MDQPFVSSAVRVACVACVACVAWCACLTACSSSYSKSGGDADSRWEHLESRAREAIAEMRERDPSLSTFFDGAAGYVVYPAVKKGALGVGGAHGEGVVYAGGEVIGYSELTHGSIGFQIGGQSFAEVVFFQTDVDLNRFKDGDVSFAANASAVALTSGAASAVDYSNGVAVFIMPRGGLMAEASIGGQKLSFRPKTGG